MPQMQFSTEVLPAPFGPMRHRSSPARVSKDTPLSTCRPPKASPTSASRSCSAIPAPATPVLLHISVAAPAFSFDSRAGPEVELPNVLVREQLLRRAIQHDAAVLDYVGVVGRLKCE